MLIRTSKSSKFIKNQCATENEVLQALAPCVPQNFLSINSCLSFLTLLAIQFSIFLTEKGLRLWLAWIVTTLSYNKLQRLCVSCYTIWHYIISYYIYISLFLSLSLINISCFISIETCYIWSYMVVWKEHIHISFIYKVVWFSY